MAWISTWQKAIIVIVFLIFKLHRTNGCACVPEDQKLAFGEIQHADLYCKEKYAKALGYDYKPESTSDEYDSVYKEKAVTFKMSPDCKKSPKGDAFSVGWYCGEYCSELCPGTDEVTCEYLKTNEVCQNYMHCVCRKNSKIKCFEAIMPTTLSLMFNESCLNCFFKRRGDLSRLCVHKWKDIVHLAQDCKLSSYGIRQERKHKKHDLSAFEFSTYSETKGDEKETKV